MVFFIRKSAGIPNITGLAEGNRSPYSWSGSTGVFGDGGVIVVSSTIARANYDATTVGTSSSLTFNASRSSTIYGSSATVTPISISCIFCIKY